MGTIDLDPCSNPPPYNVPATLHMSRRDGGLTQHWHGKVFMNPPYGRELPRWMAKLAHEIQTGRVSEAITLTPARPDTRWFQTLWSADALCFWRGRLQYVGSATRAPFPSVVGYFGDHAARFGEAFEAVGKVVFPKASTAALETSACTTRTSVGRKDVACP
jgi:hypothetical protein